MQKLPVPGVGIDPPVGPAAAAQADDGKVDPLLFDGRPVHILVIIGHVHAQSPGPAPVRQKIMEPTVDALQAIGKAAVLVYII